MILALAVLSLTGCVGLTSSPKSVSTSNPNGLTIATPYLCAGSVQANYSWDLTATGGTAPYTWKTDGGALPAGLQLNAASGAITGKPTQAGSFSFTAEVIDAKGNSTSANFSLNVSTDPAPSISTVLPSIGSSAGGTTVTISGSNFSSGAVVEFGSVAAASTQVVSSTQILAVTAAESNGAVAVDVQTSDGQLAAAASAFTFMTPSDAPWNPSVLGVPWASDFNSIAANEINVKTDPRLTVKAAGDGATDDTAAVRAAIQLASSTGGGLVYFPNGSYKMVAPSGSPKGAPLVIPSRVILRGSGAATAQLVLNDAQTSSETDGIWTWGGITFNGASLSGMTDLGVTTAVNPSTAACAVLWNRGTKSASELFFNNLNVDLGNCRTIWIENTTKLLVQGSTIRGAQSTGNSSQMGPLYFSGDAGVSILNNTFNYTYGRLHVLNDSDVLVQGNTIVRDAMGKDQDEGSAVESGGIELSFGDGVQVLNNTVQTLNASGREAGDGEAIMVQQGTAADILDGGSVGSSTATTITDPNALWGAVTSARLAQFPGEVVVMLSGAATGQVRTIQSINTSTKTLTLSQPGNPVPAAGDLYSIFRWTFSNATISGNTLIDNPNGIVIYDGCYNCTVQNNTLTNSRQIVVRVADQNINASSLYPEGRRAHQVALNVNISNNTVSDTSGIRPAYIALDVEAFASDHYRGIGIMNVQVGENTVNPYTPNPSQTYLPGSSEITQEGFFPCFFYGPAPVKDPITTVFQGVSVGNNVLGSAVKYGSGFLPYTTSVCTSPPGSSPVNSPTSVQPVAR